MVIYFTTYCVYFFTGQVCKFALLRIPRNVTDKQYSATSNASKLLTAQYPHQIRDNILYYPKQRYTLPQQTRVNDMMV